MTRLLLFLLVASNAVWVYVRTTQTTPEPRRAPRADRQEEELRQRIEKVRADLRAVNEGRARQQKAAEEREQRRQQYAGRNRAAWKKRAAWHERLLGRDEADAEAACAEVRAGLTSDDPIAVLAAIQAVWSVAQYDKARRKEIRSQPLRPLLLPFLDSPDQELRYAAASALRAVGVTPEDLPRLLALEGDARLRAMLPHLLRQAAGTPVQEQVKEAVLRLLDDKSASVVEHTLAAWGATDLGPEYLDKVIGLVRQPATRRSAISRVLARLEEKPDRVIDLLLDAVLIKDQETRDAAISALRHSVPEHRHNRIADFFVRLLQLRNNPRLQLKCLEMLEQYGRRGDIPVLKAWVSDVDPPRYVRARFDRTLKALSRRR